jgi:uncharacterized protein YjbI with pentapeptide repeats
MKRIVVFALVLNAALLGVVARQLVAIAGDGPVVTENGDTNGDGGRDIGDAIYLLQWLFVGGEEPVEIVCPADQGDRVAELEAQLAAANTVIENLQGEVGDSGGCDLSGMGLEGARLAGVNLADANLRGADLRAADLEHANLTGANLTNANLGSADLWRANLTDADLTEALLAGADLTMARMPGALLAGADLTETNLGRADLRLANLMGAGLTGANLNEADLRGSLIDSNGDGRPDLVLGGTEAEGIEVDIRVGEDDCAGIVILTGGGDGCLQGIGVDLNGDGTVDVYTVDVAEAREAIAAAQAEPAEAGGEGAGRVEGPGERLAEECVDGTVDLLDVLRVLVGESSEPSGWNIPRWHIENL